MHPQTSLQNFPGKINVGTEKSNTMQEKNIRWEKPYTASQGGISSCLCKHCWGQWSFAAVKQPQLRPETAFILLLSSMVSLPAQVMYPGNGQNALETNLCPGKSTSVDSQLEKFTSCFTRQEYISLHRAHQHFSLTKSRGVFSRCSMGVPHVLLKSPAMSQAGGGSEGCLAWQ